MIQLKHEQRMVLNFATMRLDQVRLWFSLFFGYIMSQHESIWKMKITTVLDKTCYWSHHWSASLWRTPTWSYGDTPHFVNWSTFRFPAPSGHTSWYLPCSYLRSWSRVKIAVATYVSWFVCLRDGWWIGICIWLMSWGRCLFWLRRC